MLSIESMVEWFRSWDHSDWMLFLTIWMTCLTAVILVLTIAVVRYAKRTLRVSKASLDLFSKPSVTIQGPQEVRGPDPGDNFSGPWRISPGRLFTLGNNSPMEILVPRDAHSLCVLTDKSPDSEKAGAFRVSKNEAKPDRPVPEGPYVVENTLAYKCELRGPPIEEGEPALRLEVEFKIKSYLYRGKPHGPLVARCAFIIEHQSR